MIIAIYNNAYGDNHFVTGQTIEACVQQLENIIEETVDLDCATFYDASPLRVTRSIIYTAEFC